MKHGVEDDYSWIAGDMVAVGYDNSGDIDDKNRVDRKEGIAGKLGGGAGSENSYGCCGGNCDSCGASDFCCWHRNRIEVEERHVP